MATVHGWLGRKACRKRELQSLAGLLQYASTVIRPGRCFLHRIYKTCELVSRPNHWVCLNAEVRSDLVWWHTFAQDWNGSSLLFPYYQSNPDEIVYSGAAGNWGCGAWSDTCWLQAEWVGPIQGDAIHAKEFIPIILLLQLGVLHGKAKWYTVQHGQSGSGGSYECWICRLMQLMRCLVFLAATFEFWFTAFHIAGECNQIADAISHNHMSRCFALAPWLQNDPCFVPQALINSVLHSAPDVWVSSDWAKQFKHSLNRH